MLIVTGTKRSGTSMWMQILIAAGFTPFGEAFPSNWGETLREANPSGFYESLLRQGIYWRTNPHPRTGAYFFPEQVERHVVKVFIPGLVRTDRAFIGRVVATVREWREYEASLDRLYAMEDKARLERKPDSRAPVRFPAALEWWSENFALVRDIAIRRYPVHVQSYDGLMKDPESVIRKTLHWLGDKSQGPSGGSIDVDKAVAAVEPSNRTQVRPQTDTMEPEFAAMFDKLYEAIDAGKGLGRELIKELNETNTKLIPRIAAAQKAVYDDQMRRQKERGAMRGQPAASEDEGDGPLPPSTLGWDE
jgi:hypothetical protein